MRPAVGIAQSINRMRINIECDSICGLILCAIPTPIEDKVGIESEWSVNSVWIVCAERGLCSALFLLSPTQIEYSALFVECDLE